MKNDNDPVPIALPLETIVLVLTTLLLVRCFELIAPLFLPLLIAILIAVSLTPIFRWLIQKRLPRTMALALIALTFGLSIALVVISILPSLYHQAMLFIENLPEFRDEVLRNIGPDNPIHDVIAHGLKKEVLFPKAIEITQAFAAGNIIFGSVTEPVLIFILAMYLISDGPKVVAWMSAFFEPSIQKKIDQTTTETAKIISAYVLGQFVTSALSFAFVLVSLSCLHVPSALLLASLAGILDVLPVLGFFLSVAPAMLFALKVSGATAWIVLGLYIFYHLLENYLIVPFVYGNRMRVSGLVVFFSLLAAVLMGGIEGAIVVLPIVASYSILEQIWLRRYIRKEALNQHACEEKA